MPTRMQGKLAPSLLRWAMGAPEEERRRVEARLRQYVDPDDVAEDLRCEGIEVHAVSALTLDIEGNAAALELASQHPSIIAVVERRGVAS